MTLADMRRALSHGRLILLFGLVLTSCALVWVHRIPPLYTSQIELVVLPPHYPVSRNVLADVSEALVPFAGVVQREVNGPEDRYQFASTDATLAGAGVVSGWTVEVPNLGGQWSISHRPVVSVEVVGPDSAAVAAKLAELVDEVQATAVRLQADKGVTGVDAVSIGGAAVLPEPVAVSRTNSRALLAVLILGVAVSVSAAAAVGRRHDDELGHTLPCLGRDGRDEARVTG